MSRRELLDIEAQVAEHQAAERDEHASAARFDRRDLIRIGGRYELADRVPHPADLVDQE